MVSALPTSTRMLLNSMTTDTHQTPSFVSWSQWLPIAGLLSLLSFYFFFVYTQALNVPHHDEILDFLTFVINMETAETPSAALTDWFVQYNDHRTSASRIQVYLAYLAQGEVNFHTLAILANLSLPLILVLLYVSARHNPYRWVLLLSSALLLLHLRTYIIVLWSQPTFAYCWVFVYAFASVYVVHNVTAPRLLLGALLCTLASLTLAAGQAAWLFGFASLVHQALFNQRRSWLYPCAWALIAIVMLIVWHATFIGPDPTVWDSMDLEALRAEHPGILIGASFSELVPRYSSFFLAMLGSAFTAQSTLLAGTVGAIGLGLLVLISFREKMQQDIRLVLCCWYIVATAAAVTYGRAYTATPDYALSSHYTVVSALFIACMAMLVPLHFKRLGGKSALCILLLSGLYCTWAFNTFNPRLEAMLERRHDYFNKGAYVVFGVPVKDSNAIVQDAIDKGIYNPPCRPQPQCRATPQRVEN